MRHLRDCLPVLVLAGAWVGFVGCEEQTKSNPEPLLEIAQSPPVAKPQTVDQGIPIEPVPSAKVESVPVVGEERTAPEQRTHVEQVVPAAELDASPGPVADNSLCFACHLNFKNEPIVTVHAQANIGCTQCHGASDGHRLDEDTVTPPDVMYLKSKVKSFCMGCHPAESMNISAHESVLAQTDSLKSCCTDCHGEHRLNYRTRKWDKITRSLIKDDRVLRLSDDAPERQ